MFSSSLTMENKILKSVCSKKRFVSFANIIGSSAEELGWSLTYKNKSNGWNNERMFSVPVLR